LLVSTLRVQFVIASISNFFTNRRIVLIAGLLMVIGFTGPGIFGLSPPQFLSLPASLVTSEKTHSSDQTGADQSDRLNSAAPNLDQPYSDQADLDQAKSGVDAPLQVAREFINHIPESHLGLAGSAQKDSFIRIVLPLILASNEEITKRREAIQRAFENNDRAALEKWAHLYKLGGSKLDNDVLTARLLHRADTVPVALALAQAAVESGWGTSRFALQGNALFGQWAWREHAGIRPLEATNSRAVVRSFGTLLGSVRAYMHNLNTHYHYKEFRTSRAALRDRPIIGESKILAKHLDRYAEIGDAYVKKLETLIRVNDFSRFALASLN
jgi:uncharacterized FlgJ-related protein